VHVGDLLIGVRCTDATVAGVLRRALAAHLVDDVEFHPNYSVVVGQVDGARRELHRLHRSSATLARARSTRRLAAALVSHLDSAAGPVRRDLPEVWAAMAVHDGRALLLPSRYVGELVDGRARLQAAGVEVVDRIRVVVDPATGEAVIDPVSLTVDRKALDELPADERDGRSVGPGRYALVGWWTADPIERPTAAVVTLASITRNVRQLDGQRLLADLATLAHRVPMAVVPAHGHALVDAVVAAVVVP
jgi:hypothetical protein